MLAEKFLLVFETLRSRAFDDVSPSVISTAPHIPIKPQRGKQMSGKAAN
jgi:hypothetical protein